MKFYVIRLSAEERDELTSLVETGREAAYRRRNARILLLADQGEHGPGQPDTEIVEQVGVTRQTVEKVRKRCVQDGLAATLVRRKRSRERATVLDGEGEARLVAIACSDPPAGRARWTLHMLCDELKRRRVVRSISHETRPPSPRCARLRLVQDGQSLVPKYRVRPVPIGLRCLGGRQERQRVPSA